jgi:FRG domain-containing protein
MRMNVIEIKSLQELLEAGKEAEARLGGDQLWFRGHSNPAWKLLPGANRRSPELEAQTANLFRMQAPSVHSRCPNHTDYPQWLPFMQHYGLPTRLLDWSESLAIATFFAIQGNPPTDSTVWFLNPGALNRRSIGNQLPFLGDETVRSLVEDAFSREKSDENTLAVIAPRTEARMAAQLGNYTIHGSRFPLEETEGMEDCLVRINIPRVAFDEINYDLSLLGIRSSTLFPDLDHLAIQLAAITVNDSRRKEQ